MRTLYVLSFFCVLFAGCNASNKDQVGVIYSNDECAAKVMSFLKAVEAKDSATIVSMLAEDFKQLDELRTPWVDNRYFKDTSAGLGKSEYMSSLAASFGAYDSIHYENPAITTIIFATGDTLSSVKANKSFIVKSTKQRISLPFSRSYRWKNGKIAEVLIYDSRVVTTADGYGYDGYSTDQYSTGDMYGGGVIYDTGNPTAKDTSGKK